ncbi:hypothetical protein NDR87_07350 [Nocardia sp. CDC159]|uniref:Uncharacterized protein n=1 Tax=Nocardia pulmonis TaxID=2951408 RepID=A0A9X2E574_9NOCA|nr:MULTISPECIES: hypothetical protein [Nocardia]MCM6773283.1 hypothetical protein [Nocardia pulmonis]MCM6786170.1 hypothetical protein [Nocardia sp. CDC159]
MTAVNPTPRAASVDIAGSAWPVYKLEALALALLTCLVLVLVTGSPQVAVLAAAAVAALRWVIAVGREKWQLSR